MLHFKGIRSSNSVIKMILLDWKLTLILWVTTLLKPQVAFGVSWLCLCLAEVCLWAVRLAYLAWVCPSVLWAFALSSSKEVFVLDSVIYDEPEPHRSPLTGGAGMTCRRGGRSSASLPSRWCWDSVPHLLKVIILSSPQCCGSETAWTVFSAPLGGR